MVLKTMYHRISRRSEDFQILVVTAGCGQPVRRCSSYKMEVKTQLEDFAWVRAIYELGIKQDALSMPELPALEGVHRLRDRGGRVQEGARAV